MKRVRRLAMLALVVGLLVADGRRVAAVPDYTAWVDLGIVYTAPSGDAYYPSVIYDANGFGTGSPIYKMWYSNGSGGVFVVTSTDGLSWSGPTPASGLGDDAHHVQVVYDANCFGGCGTAKYKIWYWDIDAGIYSVSAIAYAESSDGINWSNDQAITQDSSWQLITGVYPDWYGSYGPIDVIYQPSASDTGTEPWNYRYVMYYDVTDGGREFTGLAYSSNGVHWTRYPSLVLQGSTSYVWDCSDDAYGTIYHDANGYHFWYSGGGADNGSGDCEDQPVHEGIGYASSNDGLNWTKDANNPIFHIGDGVDYRDSRVYTPAVVDDGSGFLKMYYSAKGSSGPKNIGLAVLPLAANQWVTGGGWIDSPPGAAPDPSIFSLRWFQGFETDTAGWFDNGGGTVNREPSGFTDTYASGIDSASGDYHARLGTPGIDGCTSPFSQSTSCVGPFTRWGKATSSNPTFPAGGYRTSVDVYLDTSWAASHSDWRFDFSSAINKSDGSHLRDFAFNFGTDPNSAAAFIVNASTNAFRSSSFPSNTCPSPSASPNACRTPVTITTSGWYTLQHTFRDEGGSLAVDMRILNDSGTAVADWTIYSGDAISGVGGDRYGWFANQEIPNLPIDNTSLSLSGPTGPANFGFVVKYQKNASTPGGNLLFQFKAADLSLKSTSFDWLVVAGPLASFQGTGAVNGVPDHRFKVDAKDGDLAGSQPDHLKIKIWNPSGGLIYQADEDLAGGSIVVHAK